MKIIEREYLNELISVKGTPDIKVITGVRRSGKSEILKLFEKHIKANENNANIISIDFRLTKFEKLKEYHKLVEYVESKYDESKTNYILIDEVQMCEGFENAINNFHAEEKFDIYITGSNAFLLSSDLATLFTGRTFEIKVMPFSYIEFLKYFNLKPSDETFNKYVLMGGMSGSYLYNDEKKRYDYINEIYNALIKRDIEHKHKIRNKIILDNINDFLSDNISYLTSSNNITNQLKKQGIKIDHKTVKNYIKYLNDAFLFYEIKRYDIRGKKYLSSQSKYYLVDQAFKYAKIGTKDMNYGRIYENMVAIELIRRGYELYIGTLYKGEIDFVAMKRDEKLYIQVSDDISNPETFKREVSSLLEIKDAYPKILIARTHHDTYQYEGVQIIDIVKWLSEDNTDNS